MVWMHNSAQVSDAIILNVQVQLKQIEIQLYTHTKYIPPNYQDF